MKNLYALFTFVLFFVQSQIGFGQFFEPLNGPNGIEVGTLGVDSLNNVFFTDWSDDFYFSSDNGETWENRNQGLPDDFYFLWRIESTPTGDIYTFGQLNSNHLLVKLPAGSDTWIQMNLPDSVDDVRVFDVNSEGHIYVYFENTLFFSEDGVSGFTALTTQMPTIKKLFTYGNGNNFGTNQNVSEAPIYRFSDDGCQIDTLIPNYLTNERTSSLALLPSGRIVIITTHERVAYTDDNINWIWFDLNLTDQTYFTDIYQHPGGSLYITGRGAVQISTDNGESFQNVENYYFNHSLFYDSPQLVFSPSGQFYISKRNFFFNKSDNDGQTWIDLTGNFQKPYVFEISKDWGDNLFSRTFNIDGVQKSSNNGQSWSGLKINGDDPIEDISFGVNQHIFAITGKGNSVFKSENNGATWEEITPGNLTEDSRFVTTVKDNILFVGNSQGLWRSDDKGSNWSLTEFNWGDPEQGPFVHPSGNLFFLTTRYLYKSTNNGQDWESILNTDNVSDFHIDKNGNIYINGEIHNPIGGPIYYSIISKDEGWTFEHFDTPFDSDYYHLLNSDSKGNLIITQSNQIYLSEDVGETWIDLNENETIAEPVSHIYVDENQIAYLGLRRNVIYKSVKPICDLFTSTANFQKETFQITISPNPMSDFALIEIENEVEKEYTFRLFDVVGKEVFAQNFNSNQYQFRKGHLNSGIYFYQLESQNQILNTGKLFIK